MAINHPDLDPFKCPGGLFDVEPCEMDLNIGRRCRYVKPQWPAERGIHVVIGVQKNYRGDKVYRLDSVKSPNGFGRPAAPAEIYFLKNQK